MSSRVAPFHCPYCAEENLWPHVPEDESVRGAWECRSCLRAFSISFLGHIRRGAAGEAAAPAVPDAGAVS